MMLNWQARYPLKRVTFSTEPNTQFLNFSGKGSNSPFYRRASLVGGEKLTLHRFVPKMAARSEARTLAVSPLNWRTQISQSQLLHQISTILLQRKNWQQLLLLRNLNLSSNLTPALFSQIIRKTKTNPRICLDFFNWVKSNLNFQPDLNSHCRIVTISISSGLPRRDVIPTLDNIVENHSCSAVIDAVAGDCKGKSFESNVLSFVSEYFARKGQFKEGVAVFNRMRVGGLMPSVSACNAIIDVLGRENEINLIWCFYGVMIRHCVKPDKLTWSLLAPVLSKGGRVDSLDRILKILDMGISSSSLYNARIDCHSRNGHFELALDHVEEMCERGTEPGFGTYSSILDGACRHRNVEVIKRIVSIMSEKGLLQEKLSYDEVIQKLCSLVKTNAMLMFFNRARDENVRLKDSTYNSLLNTFSKEGMLEEAIQVYRSVHKKGFSITLKNSSCQAFVNLLCEVGDSFEEEKYEILTAILKKGFRPCTAAISKFISSQCENLRWRRAEEVLDLVLENGSLPDPSCLCCLVQHYCHTKQIDKAILLHRKLEKFEGRFDVSSYNLLLDGLVGERRAAEAVEMFDFMKRIGLVDTESFVMVIRVLCRANEKKKAMQVHDEMLKMRLKPGEAVYKKLILEF